MSNYGVYIRIYVTINTVMQLHFITLFKYVTGKNPTNFSLANMIFN